MPRDHGQALPSDKLRTNTLMKNPSPTARNSLSSRLAHALLATCALLSVALLAGCSKSGPDAAAQAPGGQPGGAAPPPLPVHEIQLSPQTVPIVFEAVG